MALEKSKKEQAPKPVPWGFNNNKTKAEVNVEELKQK